MTVDPDSFRGALASWPSGVTVVTTRLDDRVYGLTVSSFSSLSIDPLLVLVCIANTNPLVEMVRASQVAAISLLADHQEDVSRYFAQPGRKPVTRYEDFATEAWATGAPIISGSVAGLDCELFDLVEGGDHMILLGRVVEARFNADKMPLLYFRRGYRKVVID